LALPTVRRGSVIVDIRELLHNNRKHTFIDMTRWEVCLSEIRFFIRIVKLKFELFSELIICG
jgi:hypothetical protein